MNQLEKKVYEEGVEILSNVLYEAPRFTFGVVNSGEDNEEYIDFEATDDFDGLTYRDEMEIEICLNILKKYKAVTCAPEDMHFPDALEAYARVCALHTYLPIVKTASEVNPEEFGLLAELAVEIDKIAGNFGEGWEM